MNRRGFPGWLAAAVAVRAADVTQRLPNIILIYADDVGYGDLGCYGATGVNTPNLDRLAGEGLRLTHAHASSATCTPSRYSLLTGEFAWRRKDTAVLPGDAPALIHPGRTTLPSMLQSAGYRTGAVGKWHLGLGNGKVDWNGAVKPGPNDIGFDYSFIIPATGDRVPCVYLENGRVANLDPKDPIQVSYEKPFPGELTGKDHPELLRVKPSHGHDQHLHNGVSRIGYMTGGKSAGWVDEDIADTLTRKATGFIDRSVADSREKPFFLYFATHDIHVPRLPNARFRGKTDMGARGDAIAELDWSVGEVLATLERHGLTENSLVMFSSDNGPVVDDGYQDEAVQKLGGHKPAGIYRGGKYSNFDAGTRVPWVVRWPGQVKADSTSDAMISQVDLLGSLAAITGRKLNAGDAPDSQDQSGALLGITKTGRKWVIEHAGSLALIEDDWKYIEPNNGPKLNVNTGTDLGNDAVPQLYNLHMDPGEMNNLAGAEGDRLAGMKGRLEKIRAAGRSR